MATAAMGRMEIRLSAQRKERYEQAASMKGLTLSQWALSNLDVAADASFEEARLTRLSQADFEVFCELLEQPMPEAAQALLEEVPHWA